MTTAGTTTNAPATRPVVLISRCITFEHCRWNGDCISSPYIEKLKPYIDFITTCPESDIGLGVPRKPLRLIAKGDNIQMLQHETDADVTQAMNTFSEDFIKQLAPVDGMILKERSPSCGISDVKIYTRADKGAPVQRKSGGIFGLALKNSFPHLPCTNEGQLYNFALREHFYTQVFTIARFRAIRTAPSIKNIVDFHARHKLILMSYHQTTMRKMGKIVANHDHTEPGVLYDNYYQMLCAALAKPPRMLSPVNVLMHALGYFSEKVSSNEKKHFLDQLELYRKKKVPLSSCIAVITSWIVRFDEKYLASQYFFNPYPQALIELSNSGK